MSFSDFPDDPILVAKMINSRRDDNMLGALGIEVIEAGKDKVVGTMPVGPKTRQPEGFLHGGASVTLAEVLASIGGWLNVNRETHSAMGLEINANHLRPKRDGVVTGEAVPLHRGRNTQVWEIKIYDEERKLICISRCTVAAVERKNS